MLHERLYDMESRFEIDRQHLLDVRVGGISQFGHSKTACEQYPGLYFACVGNGFCDKYVSLFGMGEVGQVTGNIHIIRVSIRFPFAHIDMQAITKLREFFDNIFPEISRGSADDDLFGHGYGF